MNNATGVTFLILMCPKTIIISSITMAVMIVKMLDFKKLMPNVLKLTFLKIIISKETANTKATIDPIIYARVKR